MNFIKREFSPGEGRLRDRGQRAAGFSLVELLIVIALFGLLAGLAVPAFNAIRRGGEVTRAGQMVADLLVLARQEASAKNRDIELRAIDLPEPEAGLGAVQLWIWGDSGARPSGKIERLPTGVRIHPNLSPLLKSPGVKAEFPSLGERDYRFVRIRAGGRPSPPASSSSNFITISRTDDQGNPPMNFFVLRLNPVTGLVTTHRP